MKKFVTLNYFALEYLFSFTWPETSLDNRKPHILQVESSRSNKVKKVGEGVSKAFKSVSIYATPHPGTAVSRASEKDKSLTFASKPIVVLLFS